MTTEERFLEFAEEMYKTFVNPLVKENEILIDQNEKLHEYIRVLNQQLEEQKHYNDFSIVKKLNKENDDLRSENTMLSKRVKILTTTNKKPEPPVVAPKPVVQNEEQASEPAEEKADETASQTSTTSADSDAARSVIMDEETDTETNAMISVVLESGTYMVDTESSKIFEEDAVTDVTSSFKKISLKNGNKYMMDKTDGHLYAIDNESGLITDQLAGQIVNKKAKLY